MMTGNRPNKDFEKEIIPISRNILEEDFKAFLQSIGNTSTALIISGDPFIATTHHSLWLEALEKGFDVEIVNNVKSAKLDYINIVDAGSFEKQDELRAGNEYYLLIACYIGKTRLIDNEKIKI